MDVFCQSVKKYRVLWVFSLFMLALAVSSLETAQVRTPLVYPESLDMVVASVRGEEITLRDFAVYVAHQEAETDRQARVYNADNPKQYWKLHTNGQFIKVAVRDAAAEMAVHDLLFYQLASELKLELTEADLQVLEGKVTDFWTDLTFEGKETRLGVSRQDIYNTMYKIALAEKAQYICARSDGYKFEDYHFATEEFAEFLLNYEYEIRENVLKRIDFGNVTLQ